MTPFEAWSGEKPQVDHLKVFGCICYAHIPKDERKKLDSKAREAIFLGYGKEKKGYRLYDLSTKKIFYSRDVVFNEEMFAKSEERKIDKSELKEVQDIPEPTSIQFEDIEEEKSDNDEIEEQSRPKRTRRPPDHYGEWV